MIQLNTLKQLMISDTKNFLDKKINIQIENTMAELIITYRQNFDLELQK